MRIRHTVPLVLVALLAGCGGGSAVGVAGSAAAPVTASSSDASVSASSDPAESSSSGDASASSSPSTGADAADGALGAAPAPKGSVDAGQLAERVMTAAQTKKTARITSAGQAAMAFTGSMRFGDGDLAMAITISASGQKMKAILLGNAFYLGLPQKVNGKTWLKIDENTKGQLGSSMGPLLSTMRQQSQPGQALAQLKGVKATASRGPVLDGVQTVAYVVKLNSAQILAGLSEQTRKQVGAALKGATGVTTYYVGPDWLPRKVTTSSTVQGKRSTTSVLYTKWGAPVTIAAPRAADVTTSIA